MMISSRETIEGWLTARSGPTGGTLDPAAVVALAQNSDVSLEDFEARVSPHYTRTPAARTWRLARMMVSSRETIVGFLTPGSGGSAPRPALALRVSLSRTRPAEIAATCVTGDKWNRWDNCWKAYLGDDPNETNVEHSLISLALDRANLDLSMGVVAADLVRLKNLYNKINSRDYNFPRFLISKVVKIVFGTTFNVATISEPQKTNLKGFVKNYYLSRLNYKYYLGAKEHFNREGFNHSIAPYLGFYQSFSSALDHKENSYNDHDIEASFDRILDQIASSGGGGPRTGVVRPVVRNTPAPAPSPCTDLLVPIYPKFGSMNSVTAVGSITRNITMHFTGDYGEFFEDSFVDHTVRAAKVGYASTDVDTLLKALQKLSPACVRLATVAAPEGTDPKKATCDDFIEFMGRVCAELFDLSSGNNNAHKLKTNYLEMFNQAEAERTWDTHWQSFQDSLSR